MCSFQSSAVILIACVVALCQADEWTYEVGGAHGPAHWPDGNGAFCKGSAQSPIDIVKADTEYKLFDAFNLTGYDLNDLVAGEPTEAENNGHSAKIELTGDYLLSGGGLPGTYKAVQFHFHWGSNDKQGSEHKIDGMASAAELHIVHYDSDSYTGIRKALDDKEGDGLAVLGVMLEVGEQENAAFKPVFDALMNVKEEDTVESITTPFSVRDLLPSTLTRFFRYQGSLTTPGCNEVVVWTVFEEPVYLSHKQMEVLRSFTYNYKNATKAIVDNFRPVQPVNDRPVYYNSSTVLSGCLGVLIISFVCSILNFQ